MLSQKPIKEQTAPYFERWNELNRQLQDYHDKRTGRAEEISLECTKVLTALLTVCNSYHIVPLNEAERLEFILQRPSSFAAFRQMGSLFTELEKKVAAAAAKGL